MNTGDHNCDGLKWFLLGFIAMGILEMMLGMRR